MNATLATIGIAASFMAGSVVHPQDPTEGQAWTLIGVLGITMLGLLKLLSNVSKSIDRFTAQLGQHTERIGVVADEVEESQREARGSFAANDEARNRLGDRVIAEIERVPERTVVALREDERKGKREAS